jgi:hypothetical protein
LRQETPDVVAKTVLLQKQSMTPFEGEDRVALAYSRKGKLAVNNETMLLRKFRF